MPTREECKRILFKIGLNLGVSPALISTKLLSEDDKDDMVNGYLSINILEEYVKIWMQNGMRDYAHGNIDNSYKLSTDK